MRKYKRVIIRGVLRKEPDAKRFAQALVSMAQRTEAELKARQAETREVTS